MDRQVITLKQGKANREAMALLERADKESRELTEEENTQFDALVKTLDGFGTQLRQVQRNDDIMDALAKIVGGAKSADGQPLFGRMGHGRSLGDQFVTNEHMKPWLESKGFHRSGKWESPEIELQFETKAILTEDPASGGGLIVPTYAPGIYPTPLPPIRLAPLLGQGETDSNSVVAMRETVFTNAADAVAEGAVKPESTLKFEATNEPVRKIAHWLPTSEEMLEDKAQIRSYIDARLIAGVRVVFDKELLSGSGVAPHLLGFLNRPLAPPLAQGTATPLDAIGLQIATLRAANEDLYPPDAIIVNPMDWVAMSQMKTTDNGYLGASPFAAPTIPTLWGLPVVQMSGMPQGQALIGAFKSASQVFLRGAIKVQASNSHEDYFIRDLVAIRAEIRAALQVYRPQAFALVTGLTVTPAP